MSHVNEKYLTSEVFTYLLTFKIEGVLWYLNELSVNIYQRIILNASVGSIYVCLLLNTIQNPLLNTTAHTRSLSG